MTEQKPKHPGGRPRKYKTAEELQVAIDKYFKARDKKEQPYTIMGLCEVLDMDRKALIEYGGKDEFSNAIKKARDKVQNSVENRILNGQQNVAGPIFWLKNNAGWVDANVQQHDVTGNLAELVQAAVSQLTTAGISPITAAVLGKKGGK